MPPTDHDAIPLRSSNSSGSSCLGHTAGIRHADLDAGVRVLNELIFECQRSLEGVEHAKLDLDARSWAKGQGVRE